MPYRPEVQQVGLSWLKSGRSLALQVPSAICRDECNILLNPDHEGYAALQLVALRPLSIDERLRTSGHITAPPGELQPHKVAVPLHHPSDGDRR